MSNRSDIIDKSRAILTRGASGLIYTEELGWIDLGHARGEDIENLLSQFRYGEVSGKDKYRISYKQKMVYKNYVFTTGRFAEWEVKRGRSRSEVESIALAIVMHTAYMFESWQTHFSWVTDSGFSAEDLVSDLLSFYSVVRPSNYLGRLTIDAKEKALRRWDFYGAVGQHKNKSFLPLLFPDPDNPCGRRFPYHGQLPYWMRYIRPFKNINSSIAKPLAKNGVSFGLFTGGA